VPERAPSTRKVCLTLVVIEVDAKLLGEQIAYEDSITASQFPPVLRDAHQVRS
jgi:uncharacterized protein (DUF952 family)